jgi:hypothetical protein
MRIASRMVFLAGLCLVLTAAVSALIVGLAISSPQSPIGETLGRVAARLSSAWNLPRAASHDSSQFYDDYLLGAQVPRLYTLSIPRISLHAPVVASGSRPHVVEGQTVKFAEVPNAFAAGWSVESTPVGSPGNTVLVGHNNIFGEVFQKLGDLEAGDSIMVETEDGRRIYSVSQVIRLEERGCGSGNDWAMPAGWRPPQTSG